MCGCHQADQRVAGSGAVLHLELTDSTGRLDAKAGSDLTALLHRAASELDARGEVRVRVVDDATMSDLHARHSGVAGTTDVLTFDLRPMGLGPLDTDIIVCLDEAARQAATRNHSPERELLLYALHGMLHCLGHDDHDEAAYARMHAAEDAVLTAIGVGPLFAKPPQQGSPS